MDTWLIIAVAFAGSALTFFSGFGLGTLLLPVFGLFFPIETAVAMTAVVHFLNNLFKLGITWSSINQSVLWRFGLPAMLAAAAGAWLLGKIPHQPLVEYTLGSRHFSISLLKLIIGLLMAFFALFELLPFFNKLTVAPKWLPVGGLLSGFFGGLSGHQGALRSSFLLRLQLGKEAFVATGIAIACLIDLSRIAVYTQTIVSQRSQLPWQLVAYATLAAFAGAWLGNRWLKKMTLKGFQILVASFILIFSLALMLGIV